ncbi:uncharacterized protein LOC128216373 [Mya arenaria]|uniref:uncharacterized protein LOC128216373 n=1 Tax=Mya arenaria TaxID=6604 RepID=UPI0022E4FD9A|nr:uncharacterized protein LOC128216373 [Mya arenaria]
MATADSSGDILSQKDDELCCEPCLNDGQSRNVEGFCMECNEYLCHLCLDVHRKLRMLKTHHVKRGEDIPVQKPNQYPEEISCSFHTDEKITSYCQSHQQLCCDQCVILGHKVCIGLKHIGDFFKEFSESKDFQTDFENLKSLQSTYTGKMNEAKRSLEEVDLYYNNTMETFKAELDKIKIADIEKLRAIVTSYECVLCQLTAWLQEIDTCSKNKQNRELAIHMLRIKREAAAIKDNVQMLCTDDSIVRYGFTTDKTSLLRLVKAPYLVKAIDIKHKSDEKTCTIADIALLRENLIFITDNNNSSLKLFDTDLDTLVSYVKLPYEPWQISVTGKGEAYVALYGLPKILHFKLPATDLTTFSVINLDAKFYAVECFIKTLKVPCLSPARIIEVDGNGKLVGVVNSDLSKEATEKGEQFVINPCWSTQDPANGSMYLSCDRKNSITEITTDGKVKLIVKSDKLDSPQGFCMDTDGSFLVCSINGDVFRSPATDLTMFREIEVDGKCYTVECFNKTLKVQCMSPIKTIEVDGDGKQVRVINNDLRKETTGNGVQFILTPQWSTQDPANGSMYISCNSKQSITEIKSNDNVVTLLVKSDKLNCPHDMCMDIDGSILVCSYYSKDVFRMKKNEDIQSVIQKPLDFNPQAVALDKPTKKLYVGGQSDKIHVFQI